MFMGFLFQILVYFRHHQAEFYGLFAFVCGAQAAITGARAFAVYRNGGRRTVRTGPMIPTLWSQFLLLCSLAAVFGAFAIIESHMIHVG